MATTALRADARRNRELVLLAARDAIVEHGPDVPLEEVARRAAVGIGTVYRRFPDRAALLHAVVLEALAGTRVAAETAAAEEADPFDALARYLRSALELRVAAVMPMVLGAVDLDEPELVRARAASSRAVERLVDAARDAGALAEDVTFADVGMMLVRIARPLPGPLEPELKDELAHRHLELFLRGLRATAPSAAVPAEDLPAEDLPAYGLPAENLPGPVLTRDRLAEMTHAATDDLEGR